MYLAQLKEPRISQGSLQESIGFLKRELEKMENLRSSWVEDFRTEWWELEILLAVMLDEKIYEVPSDEVPNVHKAVEQIEGLIQSLEESIG